MRFKLVGCFSTKGSLCGSLALNSGVVILGSIVGLWLLPIHPTMSQNISPHGLVLAQSQSAESLYKQGMAKLQRKDYRGAVSDFNEAIRLVPNYAEAYYGRGRVRYFLDYDRGAILDFNEAIRLAPNYAEAYYGRGQVRYFLDNHRGAILDFNEAIRLTPSYAEAYYGRARAHRYAKAYKASSNDFMTARRLKPDYAKQPDMWFEFGQLLLDVGENKNALDHFNEALRLQSNHAAAHYGRAIARYELNEDLRAFISELEKTARLYREQGDTKSFSKTVAEINRSLAHLNQQNVKRRYQCRKFEFDYIEELTEAEASRRRGCFRL